MTWGRSKPEFIPTAECEKISVYLKKKNRNCYER